MHQAACQVSEDPLTTAFLADMMARDSNMNSLNARYKPLLIYIAEPR